MRQLSTLYIHNAHTGQSMVRVGVRRNARCVGLHMSIYLARSCRPVQCTCKPSFHYGIHSEIGDRECTLWLGVVSLPIQDSVQCSQSQTYQVPSSGERVIFSFDQYLPLALRFHYDELLVSLAWVYPIWSCTCISSLIHFPPLLTIGWRYIMKSKYANDDVLGSDR